MTEPNGTSADMFPSRALPSIRQVLGTERLATWLLLAAILVGFGVRVYHLGQPNLINDEWFALRSVHEGVGWIVALTRTFEPHPPLYYLLVAGWIPLVGESEFALRFVGVATGLLVVPAAGLIGRALRHSSVGVAAAWLVALNPFLVANAQYGRMYATVAAFSLLATAALLRALVAVPKHDTIVAFTGSSASTLTNRWIRYAASMFLAMATNYTAWLLFAAHGILLLAKVLRGQLPPAVRHRWAIAAAILSAGAAAWLAYGLPALRSYRGYFPDPVDPALIAPQLATVFAAGSYPAPVGSALALAVGVLSLLGAAALVRRTRDAGVLVVLAVIIPLAPSLYLMLTRPLFTERYLIAIVPAYIVLAAVGVVAVDRVLRLPLATLALLVATAIALRVYYPDVEQGRPDYRAAARYVEALAQPGDLVVVTRHGTGELFGYYDNFRLVQTVVDSAPDRLAEAIAEHRPANVWLLPAGEDQAQENAVARALLDHAHVVDDRWFNSARVIWFSASGRDERRRAIDARWDGALRLRGYALTETPRQPGDPLAVTLYWSADQPLQADYKLSLRLVDARGRVAAQVDRLPLNGLDPPRSWPTAAEVVDRQGIAIPPLLPGQYTLDLVVYDPASLRPAKLEIDAQVASSAPLETITVDRASRVDAVTSVDGGQPPPLTKLDGLALNAAHLLAQGVTLPESVRVELRWQALPGANAQRPREVLLTLRGSDGEAIAEADQPLAEELDPADWRPGETLWIRYDLPLPPAVATGSYRLSLKILGANGTVGPEVFVGDVFVQGPERSYTAPTPTHPTRIRMGPHVELVGFDLAAERVRPGDTVELTLYWHALGTPDRDFTVFTHLLDAAAQVSGQHDQPPLAGRRPTSGWRQGEYLVDTYRLRVADDAVAGKLELEVGMYDPVTGARLPTFGQDGQSLGDRIVLGQIDMMK